MDGSLSLSDRRLQTDLLCWGHENRRDLPWRRTRDPWAIHVSEVMLQQTQVDRVGPRWRAFMATYPTVRDCARVPVADIIAGWVGLGFNRRAVLLHQAATVITTEYGGRYPRDVVGLEGLPGVGAYTARAILAFAFGADVGVVDTNVGRVLARVANQSLPRTRAQGWADRLVPDGTGWEWNQTLFDLGALICKRRDPLCGGCPIAESCRWTAAGRPERDPAERSAGVSQPQSRFEGSDRQGRGRLIKALSQSEAISAHAVGDTFGWPDEPQRCERVLQGLVEDGLVVVDDSGEVRLARSAH